MDISASMVKDLREKTGAGMMDCKKALVETNGDMDKAIDYLREKGISKAAKKAERIAAEGLSNIYINGNDVRKYGSQGQQRTAALSLKLSEIELVKIIIKDTPVLLLDDVLSELDSNRQNFLINSIGEIQTIVTCTGLDEFINNRININKMFKVTNGKVEE